MTNKLCPANIFQRHDLAVLLAIGIVSISLIVFDQKAVAIAENAALFKTIGSVLLISSKVAEYYPENRLAASAYKICVLTYPLFFYIYSTSASMRSGVKENMRKGLGPFSAVFAICVAGLLLLYFPPKPDSFDETKLERLLFINRHSSVVFSVCLSSFVSAMFAWVYLCMKVFFNTRGDKHDLRR